MEQHYSETASRQIVPISEDEVRAFTVPPLSDVSSYMRTAGTMLQELGYHPVPLAPLGRHPAHYTNGQWMPLPNWQDYAKVAPTLEQVTDWGTYPGCDVGIVTGGNTGLVAISISGIASGKTNAQAIIEEHLGRSPLIRHSAKGEILMVYFIEECIECFDGFEVGSFKVLATGQLFPAYCRELYDWPRRELMLEDPAICPSVTRPQIETALQAASKVLHLTRKLST